MVTRHFTIFTIYHADCLLSEYMDIVQLTIQSFTKIMVWYGMTNWSASCFFATNLSLLKLQDIFT